MSNEVIEIAKSTGLSEDQVIYLIRLLAAVYEEANWKKIAGYKRSSLDIYQHKLKAAAGQPTIPQFTDKLCHSLGLQSVGVDPSVITRLDENRAPIMKSLRRESIYWVLLAEKEARKRK